jgi:hypothetical protein
MTLIQHNLFGEIVSQPLGTIPCPHCAGHGVISVSEATSRTGDPGTSHLAGDKHGGDSRRFRKESRQALVLMYLELAPMTAQEVALKVVGASSVSALEGTRRRVSSLKRIGLVEDSGLERHNPGSGTPSAVYRITELGRTALDCLAVTGWSV